MTTSRRSAHGNRSSSTLQRGQSRAQKIVTTKPSPSPKSNSQPPSGTVQALDKDIGKLEQQLQQLKTQRREALESEVELAPSQRALLKSKSRRKIEKDLAWLKAQLSNCKKDSMSDTGAGRWAKRQLATLRVKIADAVQVLHYIADKRKSRVLDTVKVARGTNLGDFKSRDGEVQPIPDGYMVHTHTSQESVFDYYRAAAIIQKVQVQDRLVKFWLNTALIQCRLHKALKAQQATVKSLENRYSVAQKEKENFARCWFTSLVRQAALQNKLQVVQQDYNDCQDEYLWFIEETRQKAVPKEPPPKPPLKPKKRGKQKPAPKPQLDVCASESDDDIFDFYIKAAMKQHGYGRS